MGINITDLEQLCVDVPPTLGEAIGILDRGWTASKASFEFWAEARTALPKLIAVARAAKNFKCGCVGLTYHGNHSAGCVALQKALTELEA